MYEVQFPHFVPAHRWHSHAGQPAAAQRHRAVQSDCQQSAAVVGLQVNSPIGAKGRHQRLLGRRPFTACAVLGAAARAEQPSKPQSILSVEVEPVKCFRFSVQAKIVVLLGFFISSCFLQALAAGDPLPSWSEGTPKKAIVELQMRAINRALPPCPSRAHSAVAG